MKRRDDRISTTTAAQRPEEVGVAPGVRGPGLAVRGHKLDRVNPVAGPPVLAAQPAQTSAERIPDGPHVGGGARHGALPGLDRGLANVLGQRAGLHAGLVPLDVDAAHALGLDQDHVVELRERHRSVAGPLGRHPQIILPREADDLRNVVRALHEGDRGRLLVGCQIPCLARLVPVRVAWGRHPSADRERAEVRHAAGTLCQAKLYLQDIGSRPASGESRVAHTPDGNTAARVRRGRRRLRTRRGGPRMVRAAEKPPRGAPGRGRDGGGGDGVVRPGMRQLARPRAHRGSW